MEQTTSRIRHYFQRYQIEVEAALNFLEWLEKITFDSTPSFSWQEESFRIVYHDFNPLSVAGSLATGGRFNIGGAQLNHFFSHLKLEPALYTASSLECAKKEVGEMLGNARFYAIKPKKKLTLWDLHDLIKNRLPYPELETIVNCSPLVALWGYQKVPKISQLLATFLRRKGGDGLIYPSTKKPSDTILTFYVKDDHHTTQLFSAHEVK